MIVVVNYHYIRSNYQQKYPSIFGVTPEGFRKQLEVLATYGSFISQDELVNRIQNGIEPDANKLEFLITYDDGLREQYEEALPVLESMGIPGVFYVNTSNFDGKTFSLVHQLHLLRGEISPADFLNLLGEHPAVNLTVEETDKAVKHYVYDTKETAVLKYILNFKLNFQEQSELVDAVFPKIFSNTSEMHHQLYMQPEHLINLAKKGYLGTHSHRHIPLGLFSETEAKNDIATSIQYLENLTKTKVTGIGFPYGSKEACGGNVPEIVKSCGLIYGFTTERAGVDSFNQPYWLPRYNCNDLPGGKSNNFTNLTPEAVQKRSWFY
jgi:peptidoglycan/xylan/chitin deacetylase (PgdA/CDA1 family)